MAHHIELNPVHHLTIGTMGEPGHRVFYLQGGQGTQIVSLVIEKEQASMLANSFESLLGELSEKHPQGARNAEEPVWTDLRLRQPVESLFRVGHMGLGYNEDSDQIVLVAYELVEEGEEPNVVSFWASRNQIKSLIRHTEDVVKAGRPICGNCGRPIDPTGHFCPNRNGHIH
ncbi:MAG: DUF3090 domain-containing protein [Ardenticatenaceae bacterium]|nr:DUF3090 domain-containing protein [Anaerolineales bacterium]MCB8982878.1 DUF3090 domain-containing protein [Ardenticatenaceae bacterium]MCB8986336.1 DUF3090 domain-containing protein [Ardenticatenaceae bacterium]